MEKQKRWQFYVIITVFILTLYNILPTVIFYSKPLKKPVDAPIAMQVATEISERVNSLEKESLEWVQAYSDLLRLHPKQIALSKNDPSVIVAQFPDDKEQKAFAKFLPRAGSLIPFVPAQLSLLDDKAADNSVTMLRNVGFHFNEKDPKALFHFAPKYENGKVSNFYYDLVADRMAGIATLLGGTSPQAFEAMAVLDEKDNSEALLFVARRIAKVSESFAGTDIAKRYFQSFSQSDLPESSGLVTKLAAKMKDAKTAFEKEVQAISETRKAKEAKKELIDQAQIERQAVLQGNISILDKAIKALQSNSAGDVVKPYTRTQILDWLKDERQKNSAQSAVYTLDLGQKNTLIKDVVLDWASDTVTLRLHQDVAQLRAATGLNEIQTIQQEEINRLLMNELARLQQSTDETVAQGFNDFRINLSTLPGAQSVMAMDLGAIAKATTQDILAEITREWNPKHNDLKRDSLPIFDMAAYNAASNEEKRICLVVAAPSRDAQFTGLRHSSIYVILRGMQNMIDQYNRFPGSAEAKEFGGEIAKLNTMLQKRGFISYSGQALGQNSEYARDFIFELDDYYSTLLKATREDFMVLGSHDFATLEFSDVEQRLIVQNRIDDAIQEDILRSKEAYQAAQVDLDPTARLTVPAPIENAYLSNFKRSFSAYFRGDDSKIIRWGLDLSGGKSVRIALLDHTNKPVTDPAQLHQAVNELYQRINKMGVSERTIRIENSTIVIDFPGAQGLSAAELIKASAMYFHMVNEQFGPFNSQIGKEINEFLQDVWNEAVVTNQKEADQINQIAYNKLQTAAQRSAGASSSIKDSAQIIYDAGLRLVNPVDYASTPAFNDSLSMIARLRGDDPAEWNFRGHPLMVVFANYALDGSSLENIQTNYDPSKGNVLQFSVKSSYPTGRAHTSDSPQDDFYNWTSQFSEEAIVGTPKDAFTQGRGWRLAVILNGQVISAPSLNASLRDHVMISGNFTQREVSKLATDLKAGSLSFTPKILSEQNVSPELGKQERYSGIMASIVAICLVVACMIGYYRFAGIVASVAVLFNMLVIWAVMQNIEMALTLPGIAGMLLTVAMAVDANVLVFERIREEFKISGRIASAIHLGYKKAFSAILDSNLTTIIASIILLQFDSGPVRGFAVTLVIGIVSSMFTVLFMTRYFFAGWVQDPAHKELKMAEWIKPTNFNFLKYTKPAFILTGIVLAIGIGTIAVQYKSIFGMDFTGGYSLVVDLQDAKLASGKPVDYRERVSQVLMKKGLSSKEFQIRELGRPNLLRIQLGISVEQPGKPFYNMPVELSSDKEQFSYEFQKNPRIVWLVKAVEATGLKIKQSQMQNLAAGWTSMSGQFSDAMRNNAIWALSLALVAVLVYIAFRFEWKFACAAVLGLVHDVVLTVCVCAIANKMGLPVQIDLEVIGALMTIIGYSLNDTIIVFDRVREDMRLMKKKSFAEIINHALNTTLSRTLMTSGITLLVLLTLVFLGGKSMFAFSFVMAVGVFLGTLSSLFIAAPILLWLETKDEKKKLLPTSI
ncbi:MAG: protein translocase subunit SecD [Verrucomicrobia bacterium]|nr:protein translocase subunit SecD [Verrucomicrobiota bacterium]MBS0636461.1 protein translocase subunit SecD [Verrucomicrobiota bacterium]